MRDMRVPSSSLSLCPYRPSPMLIAPVAHHPSPALAVALHLLAHHQRSPLPITCLPVTPSRRARPPPSSSTSYSSSSSSSSSSRCTSGSSFLSLFSSLVSSSSSSSSRRPGRSGRRGFASGDGFISLAHCPLARSPTRRPLACSLAHHLPTPAGRSRDARVSRVKKGFTRVKKGCARVKKRRSPARCRLLARSLARPRLLAIALAYSPARGVIEGDGVEEDEFIGVDIEDSGGEVEVGALNGKKVEMNPMPAGVSDGEAV